MNRWGGPLAATLERNTATDASARAVASAVLRFGPVSRAELARLLGLSTASLTRLTRPMISSGLLVEHPRRTPTGSGRPSLPLQIAADRAHFVGVKITADRSYGVVCDLRGSVLERQELPITDTDTEAVLSVIASTINDLRERRAITAVGIAVGGSVHDHRIVREVSAFGWNEIDLSGELAPRVELPIVVDNDVRALTGSEHWFGAGRGCASLVVITVGVGVGCGIVAHDQLLHGARGPAARIDHWVLDEDGPPCRRGHSGCSAVLLTSGAISERATEELGRPVTFEQCIGLAAAGDPIADKIISYAADRLGLLVARVADVIGPERILITGDGVGFVRQAEDVLRSSVAAHRSHLADADDLRITGSDFFDWARGAATVAIRRHVLADLDVT